MLTVDSKHLNITSPHLVILKKDKAACPFHELVNKMLTVFHDYKYSLTSSTRCVGRSHFMNCS